MEVTQGYSKNRCYLTLKGNDNLKETFYTIWELLAWNDGYFYTPVKYMVNDCEQGIEELMTRTYYVTDRKWKDSALLIGRSNRDNMEIRNKGRKLGAFISDPTTETENMVNLYAFYVLNLALRIALLETVGVRIDSTIKD